MNKHFLHDEKYDGLSAEYNLEVYDLIVEKLCSNHFSKMPVNQGKLLTEKRGKFIELEFEDQVNVLMNVINLMKSGRAGGCNLKAIGGAPTSGGMIISSNLSAYTYENVRLVDYSSSGLYKKQSINLLDLLK